MSITPSQCRAARATIQWSRKQLAAGAGITERTITDFEREAKDESGEVRAPRKSTLLAMKAALEAAGITFLPDGMNVDGGPGVRLRKKD